MWTDALRQELVGSGVQATVVCPGYVSQTGMTVDPLVPAPKLAGISTPNSLADAIVSAIKHNKAEVVVNQNPIMESLTKLMFSLGQIAPASVDTIYRWLGVVQFNQKRAENRAKESYVAVGSHQA